MRDTTLVRRPVIWLLRAGWATLPLTAGPAVAAALSAWSEGARVTAEALLWLAWGVGLLATLVPRPETLAALRTLAPAFFVLAVAVTLAGEPSTLAAAAAIAATLVDALLAAGHDVAITAANSTAYGDELRVPLRTPPALFLAPLPLARAVIVACVVAPPLLLADGEIVLGIVALVVAVPLVAVLARSLYALARRWAVLVPAGFVAVDPLTLSDPLLFLREHIVAVSAVEPDPGDVTDLRLGATRGSVVLRFDEPVEIVRAGRGRRPAATIRTAGVVVAVVRRDALLRVAATRRLPVRPTSA
jgi:hypothetical protein